MNSDRKFLILLVLAVSQIIILVIVFLTLSFLIGSVRNSNKNIAELSEKISQMETGDATTTPVDTTQKEMETEEAATSPVMIINNDIHKAGERIVKTINGVDFAFRYCPSGTFTMGESIRKNGKDYFQVTTLSKGFWMMETEVTQKQWKAVMGNNPSYFKGDDLPVEYVSWYDCQEFSEKCTKLGLSVQLPTEAQWEYACRAGTTTEYAGNINEMAWIPKLNGEKTHPVGTKKPNAWGFYDMYGNVMEWCQDWYGRYTAGKVTDPTGPSTGEQRVVRGGFNYNNPLSSASRNYLDPNQKERYSSSPEYPIGFRCVLIP